MFSSKNYFTLDNVKYRRVNKSEIILGYELRYSVYNKLGELLLRHNKVITTNRQQETILTQGFMREEDEILSRRAKDNIPADINKKNIFELKNSWLSELYFLLIEKQSSKQSNFSYRILHLSLEIQLQAQQNCDSLLASLQLDLDSHYGLIHALHVAVCCEIIGKSSDLDQMRRLPLIAAGLTHDLGIIIEQDTINEQKQSLTEKQWSHIKQHSVRSSNMLCKLGVDDHGWLDAVRHHHERMDGSGYPDSLQGAQLSLESRVLAIADIYSAMVRPTIYREENIGKEALAELYKMRGKQVDAKLVEDFIGAIGIYPPGSLVRLANNEIAVVYARGIKKNVLDVYCLISPDNELYLKPIMRKTHRDPYKIVKGEKLCEHKALLETIEMLWSH